ncbi:MAG TPA: hypothetical protein VNJ07_00140 [Chitinophagales bacterium]|nr:hypothetical protein [Chitinophagales bacterium]
MKILPFAKVSLLLTCLTAFTFAGSIDDLLQKAANARKAFRDLEAVSYYKQILLIDSNNLQALWNTSFVYQRAGWLEQNREVKKQLYTHALEYANKTFARHPATYEANIVMAGGIARMSEFLSAKERVQAAWDIKKYAEVALQLKPANHEVWYLLGWWNFEISKATWLERSLASLFFGGLPGGTSFQKGIQCMEKANELNPGSIVYMYDLATFYERTGNSSAATHWVKEALAIPPVAPEDFLYKGKCERLLSRLNS